MEVLYKLRNKETCYDLLDRDSLEHEDTER